MFEIVLDGKRLESTHKPINNWRDAYHELIFRACVQGFKKASVYHDGWERNYIIKSNGKVAIIRNEVRS